MKRELPKLFLMGGILLGVVLLTAILIHGYDRPETAERQRGKTMSPQILRQLLRQSANFCKQKRYLDAERSLKRVLNFDHDNRTAQGMLGNVYLESGRYYDAGNIFRAILARRPRDAAARNNLGVAMIHMQWYEAAIRELLTARALDPYQPGIDLNLSRAYEELGDTEKAARYRSLAQKNVRKLHHPAEKPKTVPAGFPESNHE